MTRNLWLFQEKVDAAKDDDAAEAFVRTILTSLVKAMPKELLLEVSQRVIDYNRQEWREYNAGDNPKPFPEDR